MSGNDPKRTCGPAATAPRAHRSPLRDRQSWIHCRQRYCPLGCGRLTFALHDRCLKWYVSLQLLRWLTVKEHFKMGNNKQKKNEAAEPATSLSTKMSGKDFEKKLAKLQVELVRLQTWVKDKGARVIVVFEGRDTAGKGGVISRITERTSPRVYRHVALPAPSDREKSQVYIQRYIAQFPAAGEIIMFDRSWYNRAGVERVMGFCSDDQYERFMKMVPVVEREMIVNNGIILRKYFLDVSQDEQRRRFEARIKNPMKHWKLSPMDTESVRRWW